MTFEQWLDKKYPLIGMSRDEIVYAIHKAGGTKAKQEAIVSLMKEAWDARYNTLTYHDL